MKNKWIVPAIIIAVGLFLLGQRIEQGIVRSKEAVRTVSVKGLSEREVPADKVIWPLVYKELGNDLGTIYRTINTKNTIVINFLKANGISDAEISIAAPGIVDMQAERYGNQSVPYRYNVTSVITVSSNQVEKVRELIVKQASLLEKGVAIVSGDYQYNTQFLFTKLNELKPEMIAEDFAYYQTILPGTFFFLGTGTGIPLHADTWDFDESILEKGIQLFLDLAKL